MAAAAELTQYSWTPQRLRLQWHDGAHSEFSSLWLRDNCAADRDAVSGQRLIDIGDLPADPRLRSVTLDGDALVVRWEAEERITPFAIGWLAAATRDRRLKRPELETRRWLDGAALDPRRHFAWRTLAEIEGNAATRAAWLLRLVEDGLAFVGGVPSADRSILAATALMGCVAETNYGLVFDVRTVARAENLAYSDYGLGLHTDNPYRDPVPGFQALHVLLAAAAGGETLFADGFALAAHLRDTDPRSFECLTRTPVPFLYRSSDAELYAERPLIQLSAAGGVCAIHYNNRSIAPLQLPLPELEEFYAAYRSFARLLRERRFQLRIKLDAGDLVVFDNQRTLHGRTPFSSERSPRHLQGCYLTRDSVYSRLCVLRRGAQEQCR